MLEQDATTAADSLFPELGAEVHERTLALSALCERGLAASCARQTATLAVVERHLGRIAEEPDACAACRHGRAA